MTEHKQDELRLLADTLPNVSSQIRDSLSNLYAAFSRIATPEQRMLDPELDRQAALLQQNYFRLLRLADNLSDASRLSENPALPAETVDIVVLMENLYHECRPLAELTGLSLHFTAEEPHLITGTDKEFVRRILYHLLSNALKFTPRGGSVTLRCRKTESRILLSVEDTGCGISEEQLSLIFDRYLQSDLLSPAPHGLGLGLPLTRQMAQALGGQLLMESASPGTVATLALPIRPGTALAKDRPFLFHGGFPAPLVELADALPVQAFLQNPAAQD